MPKPVVGLYPCHPPDCAEYDPRAPEVAQRLLQIITTGLPLVRVEHIGSTAVPGCAGKGVVDLMVVYPEGHLEQVKDRLRALGFQRQSQGHLHPETRPMRVGAFNYGGKTFRLHVHVLAANSPEIAELRRFRDRLRADPALVAKYQACKQAILAAGVCDPADYTHQKSCFIRGVIESPARRL